MIAPCRSRALLLALLFATLTSAPSRSSAAVIVVANRTTGSVAFSLAQSSLQQQTLVLKSGDVIPCNVHSTARIAFNSAAGVKQYELQPNAAYYFAPTRTGAIDLQRIGLGETTSFGMIQPQVTTDRSPSSLQSKPAIITVKLLVDEEEPATRLAWELRLKKRIQAASDLLEHYAHVRLKVVATDTWTSDNSIHDFERSLVEFEQKVSPAPARIAIGFTSQYQIPHGRTELGGTKGPLNDHVLVREWSQYVSEAERTEILVHELGHFLGAVHSPELSSVMRPVLGDRQARAREFQIAFDPVNSLAMSIVGEELAQHDLRALSQLPQPTQNVLRGLYQAMAAALPNDPAAPQYAGMLHVAAQNGAP